MNPKLFTFPASYYAHTQSNDPAFAALLDATRVPDNVIHVLDDSSSLDISRQLRLQEDHFNNYYDNPGIGPDGKG